MCLLYLSVLRIFFQIYTYVISLFQESSFGFDIPNASLYFINFRSSFTSAFYFLWIYSVVSFLSFYFGHFAQDTFLIKHTLKAVRVPRLL